MTHLSKKFQPPTRLADIQLEKARGVKLGKKEISGRKNYVASFDKLQIPSV